MRISIALLAAALLLSACGTAGSHDGLVDRDWTLTWIEGFDPLPAAPAIRFGSDGRLSGNTGCNLMSVSYTASGEMLTISALAVTRRACVEQRANELEAAYVRAVEAARRYRIEGGELQLLGEDGAVLARFR